MAEAVRKVVWITGSARRLGRELLLGCAREGFAVVVHAHRDVGQARAVAAEAERAGVPALAVAGDHADAAAVQRIVDAIADRFGRLDALVNSAAVFPERPFESVTEADFHATLRSNLYGPFLCTQRALPLLRAAGPGRVVNITDAAVEHPLRLHADYMASKGGLQALTRALARELAPGVLVNAIAPGPVLEPEDLPPARREAIVRRLPLGRWGSPAGVLHALLFLLRCEDVCGEVVVVDGGRSLG